MNIDYYLFDKRLARPTKKQKIDFALKMGYEYYSEMIHLKHKEGLTAGKITEWMNENTDTFYTSSTAINYSLRAMGVFRYYNKCRGKYKPHIGKNKNGVVESGRISSSDEKPKKRCSCCKIGYVRQDLKFLCHACYSRNNQTVRHNTGYNYHF